MSTNLEYLSQLHRNGVITDDDLRKGIRILKEPISSETPTEAPSSPKTEVPSIQTENKRAKRNKKKKEKRLKKKYEQLQKAVIDKLKQVLSQREKRKSVSELADSKLKLVDKPLCNYFKTYEIDAHTYKDPSALFSDKKSMLVNQINQDIREYNGIKFSIGLSVQFSHDEGDGNESLLLAKIMENKVLFLMKRM